MGTPSRLRNKLLGGGYTIGSWMTIASPALAELMGAVGFEWLGIDAEHGGIGLESIQTMMQAMGGTPTAPFVRVAWNDRTAIKRVLDMGAQGIIVPMVNSPEEAERAVRAAHFPLRGERGVGLSRAHGYSVQDRAARLKQLDEGTVVAIQIEHAQAVACLADILEVAGIDLVFLGPEDLAASMGYLGRPDVPEVEEALAAVLAAAKRAGIPAGIPTVTAADAQRRLEQGYQFIQYGVDVLYLGDSCRKRRRELCDLGFDAGFTSM